MLAQKIGTNAPTITRFCQALGFKGYSELKFHTEAIEDTIMLLNENQLERAITAISKANMVHFIGEGGTGSTATFAYHLFLQIGIPCNAFNDGMLAMMAAPTLKKDDVAIGITYSGSASNPIDALKLAKEHGATTISITGYINSPITKHSDIVLYSSSKIKDDLRYLHAARMCELSIIGLIQSGVLNKNYEKLRNNIKYSIEAIKSRRIKQRGEE